MLSAILVILAMPFTDLSRSRGIQFRPLSKIAFYIFVANFLILMVLGAKHVESPFIEFGQISTVIYFSHFLIIVPIVSLLENSLVELATFKNGAIINNSFRLNSYSRGNYTQRRSFSSTPVLRMDELDEMIANPKLISSEPTEDDSSQGLKDKLALLASGSNNMERVKAILEDTIANSSRPDKLAIALKLTDGDSKYAETPISRSNVNAILKDLLEDQKKGLRNSSRMATFARGELTKRGEL
jgi:ubiquinol-cytochrome c reductase cytochrome b subunit